MSEEEAWAVQRGFQPTPSGWLQREEILFLSQNIQWKVIKSIHDTTHLGRDSFTSIISRSFNSKGLSKTIEQITSCLTCSFNNPQEAQKPHLIQPVQHRRVFPGEDWQMDFTQMPPFQGHKYEFLLTSSLGGLRPSQPRQKRLRR